MTTIIEAPELREMLSKQRPEYVRFYETWKRVLLINGWRELSQYFKHDGPASPHSSETTRVCLVSIFTGPMFLEDFRVYYSVREQDTIYVMEAGIRLSLDLHKD